MDTVPKLAVGCDLDGGGIPNVAPAGGAAPDVVPATPRDVPIGSKGWGAGGYSLRSNPGVDHFLHHGQPAGVPFVQPLH